MFSVKKNVLQTVALLKEYGIQQIVLSPGSRNAPLMQTFSQDPYFTCHTIVDERNAAFYAIGLIQCLQKPVAVCCTSGSAVLNYAPAVAEAYYQQLPLVVISADRTVEWVGQMDGQIIPQAGALNNFIKKTVSLPEIKDTMDEWYCNRLVNEVLIACTANAPGPVHINIPIAEPLFDYSVTELPEVRKISFAKCNKSVDTKPFAYKWQSLPKRMIVVGQLLKSEETITFLESLARKSDCIILTEHLSNCVSPLFIHNFDSLLHTVGNDKKKEYAPDLVITLGGHVVSKRLKQFLREYKPSRHWHISQSGEVVDLFQSLTDLIETDNNRFLSDLASEINDDMSKSYSDLWKNATDKLPKPIADIPFSDISATGSFLKVLPKSSALHLANSSTVRNVQLFALDKSIDVYCNRGTNGIEGSLPSAVGFASAVKENVYLIVGDLSFFYGINSLWNMQHIKNLRILLINNGGGGIFHLLPGLSNTASLNEHVAAGHNMNAEYWAMAAGLQYMSATDGKSIGEALALFVNDKSDRSVLLEVTTDIEISKKAFQAYYHSLKEIKI